MFTHRSINVLARSTATAAAALGFAAVIAAPALDASAATVGYWRFGDDGAFTDATVGMDLTAAGTPQPTQVALPPAGAGSDFPGTIPATSSSNGQAALFEAAGGQTRLYASVGQLGLGSQLTVEAFFNLSSNTGNQMILSQHDDDGNQRGFWLAVTDDRNLRFSVSSNGQGSGNPQSAYGFDANDIALDTDYYVAAVWNSGNVTFYMQDLTNDGELLTDSDNSITHTAVHNSTANLEIGNFNNEDSPGNAWQGLLDEVRLSDTALTQSQLLISIPEPASLMLVGIGGLLIASRRRRA